MGAGWSRTGTSAHHRVYNVVKDVSSEKDWCFDTSWTGILAPKMSLRDNMPPVYDQGTLVGSIAHATAAAIAYDSSCIFDPSRLFIHANTMDCDSANDIDAMRIRSTFKCIKQYGVCTEESWPSTTVMYLQTPSEDAFREAEAHTNLEYYRVYDDRLVEMRRCIASGYPVIFCADLFASSENKHVIESGAIPMPEQGEVALGGLCLVATGYDDGQQRLEFRGSFGEGWGDAGYGTLSYDYVRQHCHSMWVVRCVKDDEYEEEEEDDEV
jgi:C1A family cysteine protease